MKSKITIQILFFAIALNLAACTHKRLLTEKYDGLTLQIREMSVESGNNETISYAARLIPDKVLSKSINQSVQTTLIYRMDSCFYLLQGKSKIYAALVQPIANGQSGIYEYLLSFPAIQLKNNGQLIYEDRYLNRAIYTINLDQ